MTIIVADTTCGLPPALLRQRGIPVIPQAVIFGEESFHDDTQLDTAAFLLKLKTAKDLPKTCAPEPGLYFPIFERARQAGEAVIVVAPTAKASGTVRSAQAAALEYADVDIRVVDTLTTSCNLGTLVLRAADLAGAGAGADEIVVELNAMIPRGRLYFLVDTLEYLVRGGRIGGAKRLLAELLEIKPILQIKNGQIEPFEQQRTKRRALARLVEVVCEQCKCPDEAHLCIIQVAAEQEAQSLASELKEHVRASSIPIFELPPAIVVHAGPGAMGVGFFV